jgi:hypothetical protein
MTSALIEIRLSNETEESTSPERQREQDTRYCELRGWDIAHITEDLDVSGATAAAQSWTVAVHWCVVSAVDARLRHSTGTALWSSLASEVPAGCPSRWLLATRYSEV